MSEPVATTPAAAPPASPAAAPPPEAKVEPLAPALSIPDEKAAPTETKPADDKAVPAEAKVETKATAIDDKWEPKPVDGLKRDAKVVGQARDFFKKQGFSAEQAQALIEFSDGLAKEQAAAAEKALTDASAEWRKELEADPQLGGAKLRATYESCQRLLRSLKSGPDAAKFLDSVGMQDATPLVRVFAELAARTSEDSISSTLKETAPPEDPFARAIAVTYGKTASRRES
jgi:hypothetical protein